jgi:hypothetical protein
MHSAPEGFYFQASNGSVALPVAGYIYNSDWTPCMGLFLSRSFSRPIFLPSAVSLFDLKARFFVPTHQSGKPSRAGAVKAGRLFDGHLRGLALTVPSTAAPMQSGWVSKMTI